MVFLFATVFNPIDKKLEQLYPHLLTPDLLNGMTETELLSIVGEHYPEYMEREVYLGKTTPKDLLPRDSTTSITLRETFGINKENLIVHESLNRKRGEEEKMFREQREDDIKNGKIKEESMKSRESNK
jgi:hypothetical protein